MPPERPYEHWMELVRTFRTYYDHFRIAFPHLVSIPKFYDENWGNEFRVLSREFVRNDDMHAVKRVFDSAGYGTARWDKLVSLKPEDLTGRFDQIIALNGFPKEANGHALPEELPSDGRVSKAENILGSDLWNLLLESPESFVDLLDDASAISEADASVDAPAESQPPAESTPTESTPIEVRSPEPLAPASDPAIARLVEAVGADQWEQILHDPDILVKALQGGAIDTESVVEVEPASDVSVADPEVDADPAPTEVPDEHLKALEAIREEKGDLQAQLEKLQEELSASNKTAEKLGQQLDDQTREHKATEKKLASVEEKLKEAEAKASSAKSRVPEKPVAIPPTKAAQQIQEYEASLQQAEQRLGELEAKTETDDLRIKELKEDLKREGHLRQKFEDDLEETRNALKEQVQRLHSVLKNEDEIPTIDEFEQMESDELLDYIGDVEKEKQRVMAGLEALDTQEEGYQKQIEAQNEQLGAIQDDMGKLKESNLAMEVEEMRETMEKQSSQLNMLMNYSKNLKSRNEQLVERQEPLRGLVQKLNLQEKALVRFIRINYDGKFMPESAYR